MPAMASSDSGVIACLPPGADKAAGETAEDDVPLARYQHGAAGCDHTRHQPGQEVVQAAPQADQQGEKYGNEGGIEAPARRIVEAAAEDAAGKRGAEPGEEEQYAADDHDRGAVTALGDLRHAHGPVLVGDQVYPPECRGFGEVAEDRPQG